MYAKTLRKGIKMKTFIVADTRDAFLNDISTRLLIEEIPLAIIVVSTVQKLLNAIERCKGKRNDPYLLR